MFAHPFAEEMNKSRRMVAMQSRRLAAAGWSVLLIDLRGCGDSDGEFEEATWRDWIDDLDAAYRWLAARTAGAVTIWGLRAGALLACAVARLRNEPQRLLLWQPVISGNQHLQQFLRLATVAGVLNDNEGAPSTAALRTQLAAGRNVEIAGYHLNPALAAELQAAEMTVPPHGSSAIWLELAAGTAGAAIGPASSARIDQWRAAGCLVQSDTVAGPPFWSTVEIAESPALLERTEALMLSVEHPA